MTLGESRETAAGVRDARRRVRSTKGASKARRDQINGEIRIMRSLLPITAEDQERLSYLHSMSIICTYIRKSVLLNGLQHSCDVSVSYETVLDSLPGFIVATTKEGKLVYVSENVSEYLGLSTVDVLQSDTFYDMIETHDVENVKLILRENNITADRSFVCRMIASKAFRLQHGSCCSMLVRGRFQDGLPQSSLFVALCTPTANRLRDSEILKSSVCFQTLHKPDMSFTHAPYSVLFHLGFSAEELIGRSWYSLLHPDDITASVSCHKSLIQDNRDVNMEMVVRLQCKDLKWIWLYICAAMEAAKQVISCKNHVISETEAIYLKHKLYRNAPKSSSQTVWSPAWGQETNRSPKRQRGCERQAEGPRKKTRRTSESSDHCSVTDGDYEMRECPGFISTPPYSPSSSHSSELLLKGCATFEQLICDRDSGAVMDHLSSSLSPPRSPPGFSSQTFSLSSPSSISVVSHPFSNTLPSSSYSVCLPDTHLVPVYQPVSAVLESSSECVLHPERFSLIPPPQPQGGGSIYPAAPDVGSTSAGLLTPEASPTEDRQFHYSEKEQAEISILAHQISSLASSFDMYSVQASSSAVPQPLPQNTALCWQTTFTHPLKPELLLDERVIDSILRDLDVVSGRERTDCVWNQVQDQVSSVTGAQTQTVSLDSLVQPLPFSSECVSEPRVGREEHNEINAELHQLNHCLHGSIQEDWLTEESMY